MNELGNRDRLAETAGRLLAEAGWSLVAAESCTGGLLGHRVTSVSGSSRYFSGGVVAYADEVKTALLGVDAGCLAQHGAVSEQTAREMAEGVRRCLGADLGIGVTGIAGPSGGSAEKPVGLVFVALAHAGGGEVRRCMFSGERGEVKQRAVDAALQLLIEFLERDTES